MEEMCTKNNHRATKLVRATVEEIQYFLKKNHQFEVIHLLRDPRGKINSQLQLTEAKIDLEKGYASNLCRRQFIDITLRKEMEKMYPKMFMEMLYDNVASNTLEIFSFGESVPEHVKQWILLNTSNNNTKGNEGHYNTVRKKLQCHIFSLEAPIKRP